MSSASTWSDRGIKDKKKAAALAAFFIGRLARHPGGNGTAPLFLMRRRITSYIV
jgi:hypothetical protein